MSMPQNAQNNPFLSQQGGQSATQQSAQPGVDGSQQNFGAQQGTQSGVDGSQQVAQSYTGKVYTPDPENKVDFVCPFCMGSIPKVELRYYCTRCLKSYKEKDLKKKFFKPPYWCYGDSPESADSEDDSPESKEKHVGINITSQRLCPNCEYEKKEGRLEPGKDKPLRILPEKVYNARNEFRLCMTGYRNSGKTQYIAHLVEYMKHFNLPGIANHFLDEETQNIMLELAAHIGAPEVTPVDYLRPLLFEFSNRRNSYSAVLYDIAGEDFRNDTGTLATKCVWNANNILLIIDPTTIMGLKNHPEVQKEVQKEKEKEEQTPQHQALRKPRPGVTEPFQTYQTLIERNFNQRKDWKKFGSAEKFLRKVNLAIVFSKMDLFYGDAGFPSILAKDSAYISDKKQFYGDIEAVHKAMIQWLTQVGGDAVVSNVTEACPNARIFGVSSGSEQDPDKTNRLLDPFLWLLYQNGLF